MGPTSVEWELTLVKKWMWMNSSSRLGLETTWTMWALPPASSRGAANRSRVYVQFIPTFCSYKTKPYWLADVALLSDRLMLDQIETNSLCRGEMQIALDGQCFKDADRSIGSKVHGLFLPNKVGSGHIGIRRNLTRSYKYLRPLGSGSINWMHYLTRMNKERCCS